jgi:hypothetical protein
MAWDNLDLDRLHDVVSVFVRRLNGRDADHYSMGLAAGACWAQSWVTEIGQFKEGIPSSWAVLAPTLQSIFRLDSTNKARIIERLKSQWRRRRVIPRLSWPEFLARFLMVASRRIEMRLQEIVPAGDGNAAPATPQKPNWSKSASKAGAAKFLKMSVDSLDDYLKQNPTTVRRISRQLWLFDKNADIFNHLP